MSQIMSKWKLNIIQVIKETLKVQSNQQSVGYQVKVDLVKTKYKIGKHGMMIFI